MADADPPARPGNPAAAKPGRGDYWRHLFARWPAGFDRSGFLLTELNESVRFVDFACSAGVLLLQRDKPDVVGARKVFVTYDAISAVKLDDPGDLGRYAAMGFQPPAG